MVVSSLDQNKKKLAKSKLQTHKLLDNRRYYLYSHFNALMKCLKKTRISIHDLCPTSLSHTNIATIIVVLCYKLDHHNLNLMCCHKLALIYCQ